MAVGSQSVLAPQVVMAVVMKPHLWMTAISQIAKLAPRGWWHRAPFLPVPPADYWEFRSVTQYGGGHGEQSAPLRPQDVVDYLEWCRQWNKAS